MELTYLDPSGSPGKTSEGTDVVDVGFAELVPPRLVVQRAEFTAEDPACAGTMTMTWRLDPSGEGTLLPSPAGGHDPQGSTPSSFSRRLLGFAVSDRHDADLAVASIRMAAAVRGGTVSGVIFHTDQGSEGGFNRSSQHLDLGGVAGQADSVDESAYWTGADEVPGGAAASAGSGARVLA
jgi:hypothetical protein